jgi:GMP synthase (glutamine-hydrolysing)
MVDATLLVLQHIACEPPAAYEDEMLRWGAGLHRVEVDEGEPLPDWRAFDGIVAMGGPMGAYDDDTLPWLSQEKQLIAEAVRADVPYWGVCLGSQLLAASLGAAVFPGPAPEVGVLPVEVTDAGRRDPVFGLLPDRFPSLQWHSDTYELPVGACTWPARRPTSSRPSSCGVRTDCSSTSRCRCRWRPSGLPCPPTRRASRRWRAR